MSGIDLTKKAKELGAEVKSSDNYAFEISLYEMTPDLPYLNIEDVLKTCSLSGIRKIIRKNLMSL